MNTPKDTSKKFVDIDNSRVDEQRTVMQDIVAADHCPFCLENLKAYHKEPILKEGAHWIVTKNQWPYDHTKVHLLFISRKHATRLEDLDLAAGAELLELAQWAVKEYSIVGGGLVLRFGDTNYSAGTVAHLHAQLLFPDIEAPDYDEKPVKVKIGKMWKDRVAKPDNE
ncbi:HIT family protein [Candidatus Woesebacteria bacterium]|nr:HIT family protein [Candidatus Woesebacteria bacterium]